MQNQEHIYESKQSPENRQTINTDPREQRWQAEEPFQAYGEGYRGPGKGDIWSEGEKLRVEPEYKNKKSVGWLLGVILLLCAVFLAGSFIGAIVSWLSWLILSVLAIAGSYFFILNWRIVTIPMPERRFQVTEHARL